jgi:two-component system, NtrC family, sensor kinase
VNAYQLSRIESLAADLAVALEIKSFQSQLVQSENLAAPADVLALREYHLRTRSIEVAVTIETDLPPIVADEDQCKQVLLNLLNNAIDAVESGDQSKRITIRAFQRDDRASIVVEDSGPGFRDLKRAFDPFYTTKPVGKGTALGLSICHGIVKEHGGEIKVENLPAGGAAVTVQLPAGELKVRTKALALPWGSNREKTVGSFTSRR